MEVETAVRGAGEGDAELESGGTPGPLSGPAVRATSSPVATCLTQMREVPSRDEAKAMNLPSAERLALPLVPE